jgi:hypothetical protein
MLMHGDRQAQVARSDEAACESVEHPLDIIECLLHGLVRHQGGRPGAPPLRLVGINMSSTAFGEAARSIVLAIAHVGWVESVRYREQSNRMTYVTNTTAEA